MTNFSKRIKQLRTEHGLTQKQMAIIIGVNERTYQYWENAKYSPKFESMIAITKNFEGVSLIELGK